MTPCLLLLAAGAARRMRGRDKLLEPLGDTPLLRVLCQRGLAAGLDVRVSVPSLTHERARLLSDLAVTLVPVPDHADGMSASLRAGLAGLDAPSVLVLPADMPEITEADLRKVASHPGHIVQATTENDVPGHPVRFPAEYFDALRALSGDVGARAVLQAHRDEVALVALPGKHARTDLDTPEAWAAWRDRNGRP